MIIYFIIQLDNIITLIVILTILSFIAFITSLFVLYNEDTLEKYKHLLYISFGSFLIGSLLITFIPSSKDAYEIYKATYNKSSIAIENIIKNRNNE